MLVCHLTFKPEACPLKDLSSYQSYFRLQFHEGSFFACQQLFYVDHVAVLTAYWLFRISLDRASLLIQVLIKWAPPPPILIIVSFIGEICGTKSNIPGMFCFYVCNP